MVKYECLYCNHKWDGKIHFYITDYEDVKNCPICGDSNIKKLKYDDESRDCYGYNLNFLKKKKIVKKEEK